MKNQLTKTSIITAILVAGPLLAYAWTSAPSSPPSNNVYGPLNVGPAGQFKSGGIILNSAGLANSYGLLVQNGRVGIGTLTPGYKLQVGEAGDGSSVGSNAFFYISDASLKNNVVTLPDALAKVLELRGVSFSWKNSGGNNIGVIAQEIEKVYPELVMTDPNTGLKSVQEGNLVAPLIEAVKAQQAQIEALKARISALEAKK